MSWLSTIFPYLTAVLGGMLLGIGLMVSVRYLEKRIKRLAEEEITSVMFVGVAGSGKTSLLMALTGEKNPVMTVTTSVNVWQRELIQDGIKRKFALIDTVGQNFSSVVEAIPQLRSGHGMKRSSVGALVIVVDLIDSVRSDFDSSTQKAIDLERVSYQLSHYNDVVVQMLAGVIDIGAPIILFINKIDAIEMIPSRVREEASLAYEPLIDRLSQIRGTRLEVIVGSALTGENISKVTDTVFNAR